MSNEAPCTDDPEQHLLRTVRVAHGRTMTEVAKALNVDPSLYSKIERGKVRPTPELAKKIEEHFPGHITRLQILYPDDYNTSPSTMPNTRS